MTNGTDDASKTVEMNVRLDNATPWENRHNIETLEIGALLHAKVEQPDSSKHLIAFARDLLEVRGATSLGGTRVLAGSFLLSRKHAVALAKAIVMNLDAAEIREVMQHAQHKL